MTELRRRMREDLQLAGHPPKVALSPGAFARKYLYNAAFDSDYDRISHLDM